VSKTSREYTGMKHYGERDGMKSFAERQIRNGCDFVLLGHRHVPEYLPIDKGVYVNLGDWLVHFTYAVFDGTSLQLKNWNGEKAV